MIAKPSENPKNQIIRKPLKYGVVSSELDDCSHSGTKSSGLDCVTSSTRQFKVLNEEICSLKKALEATPPTAVDALNTDWAGPKWSEVLLLGHSKDVAKGSRMSLSYHPPWV